MHMRGVALTRTVMGWIVGLEQPPGGTLMLWHRPRDRDARGLRFGGQRRREVQQFDEEVAEMPLEIEEIVAELAEQGSFAQAPPSLAVVAGDSGDLDAHLLPLLAAAASYGVRLTRTREGLVHPRRSRPQASKWVLHRPARNQ
jgi:hypothetical protein